VIWSTQLSTSPNDIVLSTLTAPVGIADVGTPQGPKNLLFLLGANDTLFALDASDGKVIWQKTFPNTAPVKGSQPGFAPTPPTPPPVIGQAKGAIYFITSDGKRAASPWAMALSI
jgi:outer membrane protein assembly factor BamB